MPLAVCVCWSWSKKNPFLQGRPFPPSVGQHDLSRFPIIPSKRVAWYINCLLMVQSANWFNFWWTKPQNHFSDCPYLLRRAGRAALSGQGHRVCAHRRRALHRRRRHHARETRVARGAVAPRGPARPPRARLRVRAGLADLVAGRAGAPGFHIVTSLRTVRDAREDYKSVQNAARPR